MVTMNNNYRYWKSTLANIFNQTKSEFVGCKFGIDITWSKRDDLCVQPVCFTLVKKHKDLTLSVMRQFAVSFKLVKCFHV